MKTILFVRGRCAYLPEIAAYKRFLEKAHPDIKAFDSADTPDFNAMDFDVIWRFMGTDISGKGRYRVHEYNSLSAGAFPQAKNTIKRRINKRPDRRVFLNDMVRREFGFHDDVPSGLRDMGVAPGFFEAEPQPEYDFVYAGSMHRGGEVLRMLEHFTTRLRESSILVIGAANSDVLERYKNHSNIVFSGPVAYEDVPGLMTKGRYGLNVLPDRYPFNLQPATKVLEYCALGLPVVSMRYSWIEGFMKEKGGQCFWLEPDFENLTPQNLESFDFKTPSVSDLSWDDVIADSKIFDFLSTL